MTTTASGPAVLPAMPVGAVWHRVALQVNPFGYQGRNAPANSFASEDAYNRALIDECHQLGIDLIGVTDHWAVDKSTGLIAAAEAAGVATLPGMEVATNEGLHLLVLFERHTSAQDIVAMIGACGGTPGCHTGHVGKSFTEIVACAVARGAAVIPAHVNGPDGLLTGLGSGNATIERWRNPDVHAVAVSPGLEPRPHDQLILENKDPAYERAHPVAVLHADDICEPTRLGTEGGSCWVKMATPPSLAGLQLAFRTPATRISLTDPAPADHPTIGSVSWVGGFLADVEMRFSPYLTCLIGGRGTGKSTVVESLRFGLGIEPIGPSAARRYQETVSKVLQPGTKVHLTLRIRAAEYTVDRTVPDPPVVRDAAGTVLASTPSDLLGPVEIFGQHELAELAESKDYVARLLRRLGAEPLPGRTSVREELRRNRETILAVTRDLETLDEQLGDLPRQREELNRFEAEGLDTRLAEQSELDRQQIVLRTAEARLDDLTTALGSLRDPDALDAGFASTGSAADGAPDGPVTEILGRLRSGVSTAVDTAESAVSTARGDLAELRRAWSGREAQARAGYEAALRTLQDSGLDAQRYLAVRSAVQTLTPLAERRPQLAGRLEALREQRRLLLGELSEATAADRKQVADACGKAGAALKGIVRVRPVPSDDRQAVHTLIESTIAGQRGQIRNAVAREDFAPHELADAARAGIDALSERFGIRGAQAANLAAAGEPLFLRLEELTVPTAAQAFLNVDQRGGNDFRALSELSQGQKATALLLLLLTSGSGPLIIDQPEDDLDNRFIWEGIVPRLRTLKSTRQLVLSTHNANIPVLGDAELVVALDVHERKGRIVPDGTGSLDEEPVRVLAEQILEGGREAFDRRRHLYGF